MGRRSTALLACVLVGCSSAAALQGLGGRCFLATDCKPGLVCVTQPDRTRRCTNDLTAIEGTEDAGAAVSAPVRSGVPVDVGAGPTAGGDGGGSGGDAGGASDGGPGGEGGSGDDGASGDQGGPDASSGDEAADAQE